MLGLSVNGGDIPTLQASEEAVMPGPGQHFRMRGLLGFSFVSSRTALGCPAMLCFTTPAGGACKDRDSSTYFPPFELRYTKTPDPC